MYDKQERIDFFADAWTLIHDTFVTKGAELPEGIPDEQLADILDFLYDSELEARRERT